MSRLSFGIVGFALPLYAYDLGMSLAQLGMLASFNTVVSLALKPIMGRTADRIGYRRGLLWATILRSAVTILYLVAAAPAQLFAVRGVHGLSDSARDPAVAVLLADRGGKRAIARSFAWYQTAKTIAGSLGKTAGGLLIGIGVAGFAPVFLVAAGLSLLPVLLVATSVKEPRHPESDDATSITLPRSAQSRHQKPRRSAPNGRRFISQLRRHRPRRATPAGLPPTPQPTPTAVPRKGRYVVLGFLVSGSTSMLGTLFPVLAVEYAGLTPAQAGALYLVTPVLALTGPLFGWLSDSVSRSLVLSIRSGTNVLSSLVFLLAPTFAGFLTGKALDDLGKAAFRPAWGSVMADVAAQDPKRRARIMGWLSAGEDAGSVVAPIVAGLIWGAWGIAALLLTRAGLALVAEIYAVAIARRPPAVSEPRGRRLEDAVR